MSTWLKDTMMTELIDLYALAEYLSDAVACEAVRNEMADRVTGTKGKTRCASAAQLQIETFKVHDIFPPSITKELEVRSRIEPMAKLFQMMHFSRSNEHYRRSHLFSWLENIILVTKSYVHWPCNQLVGRHITGPCPSSYQYSHTH